MLANRRLNANLDGHEWHEDTERAAVVGDALNTDDPTQALERIDRSTQGEVDAHKRLEHTLDAPAMAD